MQLEPFVQLYLEASLACLLLGSTLGALLALGVHLPGSGDWVLVHVHLNLIGFVLQMIFGISYHVVPRFAGLGTRPFSPRFAVVQFWLVNIGLVLLLAGFAAPAPIALGTGGVLLLAGIYLYVANLWLTLRAGARRNRS